MLAHWPVKVKRIQRAMGNCRSRTGSFRRIGTWAGTGVGGSNLPGRFAGRFGGNRWQPIGGKGWNLWDAGKMHQGRRRRLACEAFRNQPARSMRGVRQAERFARNGRFGALAGGQTVERSRADARQPDGHNPLRCSPKKALTTGSRVRQTMPPSPVAEPTLVGTQKTDGLSVSTHILIGRGQTGNLPAIPVDAVADNRPRGVLGVEALKPESRTVRPQKMNVA